MFSYFFSLILLHLVLMAFPFHSRLLKKSLFHGLLVFFLFFSFFFLLVFNLPTYRITPSARHPFTPTTRPPPRLPPLVCFPELGVSMFCLPFWYFPHISSPFPYIPFHYYLYSPNEWEHIIFVLLRLTYFTQLSSFSKPVWGPGFFCQLQLLANKETGTRSGVL